MRARLDPRRHLGLEGTYNTRDIGGYATEDGRQTRWGVYLRSDSLHQLSEGDRQRLRAYGLRTVIDLRRSREIHQEVNVFSGSSEVTYYHHNMIGDIPIPERQSPPGVERTERKRWSYSVVLDKRKAEVRDTLGLLANPEVLPAVVHCAGGADRTGLITALTLGLVGVPAETIAEDYALTARFNLPRHLVKNPDLDRDTYTWEDFQADTCSAEIMLGVLRDLDLRYCGVEGYARHIGVEPDQIANLRQALVE